MTLPRGSLWGRSLSLCPQPLQSRVPNRPATQAGTATRRDSGLNQGHLVGQARDRPGPALSPQTSRHRGQGPGVVAKIEEDGPAAALAGKQIHAVPRNPTACRKTCSGRLTAAGVAPWAVWPRPAPGPARRPATRRATRAAAAPAQSGSPLRAPFCLNSAMESPRRQQGLHNMIP